MHRPECIKDEYLIFLDSLKDVNLSDVQSLLLREFSIEPDTASIVMAYWTKTLEQNKSLVLSGSSK